MPFPVGFSESQSLSPYLSRYAGGVFEKVVSLSTYLDVDIDSPNGQAFARLRVPIDRPRSDPRDDVGNRVITRRLFGHRAFVTSFASDPRQCSPSETGHLVTSSLDSTCRLWDVCSHVEIQSAQMQHSAPVLGMASLRSVEVGRACFLTSLISHCFLPSSLSLSLWTRFFFCILCARCVQTQSICRVRGGSQWGTGPVVSG
jgi:WD40 repeat protein